MNQADIQLPSFIGGRKKNLVLLLVSIAIMILSAFGCKVRQVQKTAVHTQTEENRTTRKDSTGEKKVVTVDTSTHKQVVITSKTDSSTTTTDLTPDSGTTTIINPDGSISGHFNHIKRTNQKHTKSNSIVQTNDQKHTASITDQQSHVAISDSSHKKAVRDSTNKKSTSNSTIAANLPLKWIIPIVVVLLLLGLFIWKYKKWFGVP